MISAGSCLSILSHFFHPFNTPPSLLLPQFFFMGNMATQSQFHVLAVDDSLIDRKLIERLLKTSSYQGISLLVFVFVSQYKKRTRVDVCGVCLQWLQWILEARLWSFWDWMVRMKMKKGIRVLNQYLLQMRIIKWEWIWSSPIIVCQEWRGMISWGKSNNLHRLKTYRLS